MTHDPQHPHPTPPVGSAPSGPTSDDVLPPGVADALARIGPPPASADGAVARVMAQVRQRPRPMRSGRGRGRRRLAGGVWTAPAWSYAAAASLLVAAALAGRRRDADHKQTFATWVRGETRAPATAAAQGGAAVPTHVVVFSVSSVAGGADSAVGIPPSARRVAVVGDFNGWDVTATPLRRDPSAARWTTRMRLPAGRYVYAFVVDGRHWRPDPDAPLAPADGFGRQNSVLLVAPQLALGTVP